MAKQLPSHAQTVVIGGGSIGCNTAYHLTKLGMTDVIVLERDQLTSGTTWHAAGLMTTYGSTSETSLEMRKYSRELYAGLEQETGQATGFKACGFIEVASDADRLEEQRRVSAFNRLHGIDVVEISPAEVLELFSDFQIAIVTKGTWNIEMSVYSAEFNLYDVCNNKKGDVLYFKVDVACSLSPAKEQDKETYQLLKPILPTHCSVMPLS